MFIAICIFSLVSYLLTLCCVYFPTVKEKEMIYSSTQYPREMVMKIVKKKKIHVSLNSKMRACVCSQKKEQEDINQIVNTNDLREYAVFIVWL